MVVCKKKPLPIQTLNPSSWVPPGFLLGSSWVLPDLSGPGLQMDWWFRLGLDDMIRDTLCCTVKRPQWSFVFTVSVRLLFCQTCWFVMLSCFDCRSVRAPCWSLGCGGPTCPPWSQTCGSTRGGRAPLDAWSVPCPCWAGTYMMFDGKEYQLLINCFLTSKVNNLDSYYTCMV